MSKPTKTKPKVALASPKDVKTIRLRAKKVSMFLAFLQQGLGVSYALQASGYPQPTHYHRMRTNPGYAKLIKQARGNTLKNAEQLLHLMITYELQMVRQAITGGIDKAYKPQIGLREALEYVSRRNPQKYSTRQQLDHKTEGWQSGLTRQERDIILDAGRKK